MAKLFNFLLHPDSFESRKVAVTEILGSRISTMRVYDGDQPFETGLAHPEYNLGEAMIVEAYSTHEDALRGHKKWVNLVALDQLPETIKDCINSEIGQLAATFGGPLIYTRQRNAEGHQ